MFLAIFTSLLLSFSIRLGLAIILWPHRRTVLHQLLFFVQFFYMIWSFLVLACISVDDFETKVILTQMRQLSLPLLMPTWVLLALGIFYKSTFERIGSWRYLIYLPGFIVIAGNIASMMGLPFAREWIFFDFQSSDAAYGLLLFKYGPLMNFNFIYIYLLNISVIGTLIYIAIKNTGLKRSSALLLLLASLSYVVMDSIGRKFFPQLHAVQLSVATTWPGGLILFYVVAKLELLDVKGLAQQRIFESLPSPVVTVSPAGLLWDANASALDVLDLDQGMIGKDARGIPSVSPLLEEQGTISLKNRIYQVFHHQLNFHGAKDTARIYILNDISTITELNHELTEQNQVLQDLNQKILHVTNFNRKVQSILSHDLTGSLSSVKFLLEGLKNKIDRSGDSQTLGFLKNAIEASGSSLSLLKDILAWSHDEESQQLISVEASLTNAIKQLAPQILEKEITLVKDLLPGDVQINVSRKMLEAVFRNLLSNAIKYSPRQGLVAINCKVESTELEVTFTDNGPGMSAEKVSLLLGQNYQQSELDGEFGLGLGLKFTFDFIKQMNGEITIHSEVGRGSKFILKLPLTPPGKKVR